MRGFLLGALILVVACGGEEEPSGGGGGNEGDEAFDPSGATHCNPPDGVYRVTYHERSGTCGSIPEEVVRVDPASGDVSGDDFQGCRDTLERADNGCSVEFESICNVYDPATGSFIATRSVVGTTSIVTADASRLEGSISISISASSGLSCRGSYDVTYTRL